MLSMASAEIRSEQQIGIPDAAGLEILSLYPADLHHQPAKKREIPLQNDQIAARRESGVAHHQAIGLRQPEGFAVPVPDNPAQHLPLTGCSERSAKPPP